MSLLTGLKAVTTRTRSLRQVVTTRRIRSRCVDPRFKCRSSPATTSMPRSNGSLRITSSASSGVTRWRQVPGIRVIPIELDLGAHFTFSVYLFCRYGGNPLLRLPTLGICWKWNFASPRAVEQAPGDDQALAFARPFGGRAVPRQVRTEAENPRAERSGCSPWT